jgi:hypothetical protein
MGFTTKGHTFEIKIFKIISKLGNDFTLFRIFGQIDSYIILDFFMLYFCTTIPK